jgi:hypothetical protein
MRFNQVEGISGNGNWLLSEPLTLKSERYRRWMQTLDQGIDFMAAESSDA